MSVSPPIRILHSKETNKNTGDKFLLGKREINFVRFVLRSGGTGRGRGEFNVNYSLELKTLSEGSHYLALQIDTEINRAFTERHPNGVIALS